MAKEDFCFTYYDGDVERDIAFMTKSERGNYFDIMRAQRNFGHLSFDKIKKIMGDDFEKDFPAIKEVLKCDDSDKYFIEWVDASILKSKIHSQKQKQNADKRWKRDATAMPPHTNGIGSAMPLEDGNRNGNDFEKGAGKTFVDSDEEKLIQYDEWGEMILQAKDQIFESEMYRSKIDPSEITQDRLTLYLGLLNTYPKKRPSSQQAFRKSLLAFIIEQKLKPNNGNHTTKSRRIAGGITEEAAARFLGGT